MSKLRFILSQLAAQLWIRPTVYSLAAIFWVILGSVAEYFLPQAWRIDISKETLVNLFSILASTMLTVAIFSVSAIAAAYASVATSATPRATKVVMSDRGVQSTLAAFLATFIYAVVSLTALSAINFQAAGRLVLFVGFVVLVFWVLLSFLSWVDRVTRLGRLGDTLSRVSAEAHKVFSNPHGSLLQGRRHSDAVRPESGCVLRFANFGYVQHIDMAALQGMAEKLEAGIWLDIRPGTWAEKSRPYGLLVTEREPSAEDVRKIQSAITLGDDRSFSTDPRFALIVLTEIADRALSPAVNDPGTAISVLAIELELFHLWVELEREHAENYDPAYDRVYVPRILAGDLVQDAFVPIARDGAASVEVCIRLQKTLQSLKRLDHDELRAAVDDFRTVALEQSDHALVSVTQRDYVRKLARDAE